MEEKILNDYLEGHKNGWKDAKELPSPSNTGVKSGLYVKGYTDAWKSYKFLTNKE